MQFIEPETTIMTFAYCSKCLLPSTKPYITFDDNGVCSGCLAADQKRDALNGIDWPQRAQEFDALVDEAKSKNAPLYDALVPVSGGKDSITQVHRLLDKGLRILAVNIDYGIKTEIGQRNLAVIPRMGANLMVYTPERDLQSRLVRLGYEDFGDPDLLSHTMLHAMPIRIALQFDIPLVLLGENSAFEYGGDDSIASSNQMTRDWFMKYAANEGQDARYISERYGIPYEKLIPYDFPDELDQSGTKAVFMSHYFMWDSEEHFRIAQTYGFTPLDQPAEGTYRTFVGIDERLHRIHQYFKILKFGYGRATDHACDDIRAGRLTRDEAKDLVRKHDLQDLSEAAIDSFLSFTGMTRDEFMAVIERYRNPDIWQLDNTGQWIIPGHLAD